MYKRNVAGWSTILTFNIGLDADAGFGDDPVWHASASKTDVLGNPLRYTAWPRDSRAEARQICEQLLKGVGAGTYSYITGVYAIHARRRASAADQAFHQRGEIRRANLRASRDAILSPRPREPKIIVFPSVEEVRKALYAEHDKDRHLYRGQLYRRPRHRYADPHNTVSIHEALYPSDFRFFQEHSSSNEHMANLITVARKKGRDERDAFCTFLRAKADAGVSSLKWLKRELEQEMASAAALQQGPAGPIAEFLLKHQESFETKLLTEALLRSTGLQTLVESPTGRRLWSLAQHYGIATALVDVTFSIDVALWFATNPWKENERHPSKGPGVVYRFDRPGLEKLFAIYYEDVRERSVQQRILPPPRLFIADIRDIPKSCALRPNRQQGASIYGFDQIAILDYAERYDLIHVFEFSNGATTMGDDLPIRDYLIPLEDPFLELTKDFE